MTSKLRVALIQMCVKWSKSDNIQRAQTLVKEAANNGAKLVALPEYFTVVPDPDDIEVKKEPVTGNSTKVLSEWANQNKIYLVGGTLPVTSEQDPKKVWNMCSIFNPSGDLVGRQSKMHMFDVDLGPHLKVTESDFTIPGSNFTTFDTGVCKVGVGVCMDLRYPEVSRIYIEKGCKLLIFLGAFNAARTGPAHWEVLQRVRAIDNQVYVMAVSPGRDETHPYVVYGHSGVANPWGDIIASTKEGEEIVYADLDMDFVETTRACLPLEQIRRNDMYKVVNLTETSDK